MAVTVQEIRQVLRAQAGDKEALNELFRLVQRPLFHYIRGLVEDLSLAEDILQEVFIRIYVNLRWLREPELFRPWAYRIASRESFKRLKKERRWTEQVRGEEALADTPATSVSEPDFPITGDELAQFVAQLSPASRAVILLHYLHDMTIDEVAEVLGVSVGTVKSRLAYGLQSLRKRAQKLPQRLA